MPKYKRIKRRRQYRISRMFEINPPVFFIILIIKDDIYSVGMCEMYRLTGDGVLHYRTVLSSTLCYVR